MIYVDLKGRIGNQLFIYAFSESLRRSRGGYEKIIFCDYQIIKNKWKNSLKEYSLNNVEYHPVDDFPLNIRLKKLFLSFIYHFVQRSNYRCIAKVERYLQPLFSKIGIIAYQNGYMSLPVSRRKDVYVTGYFQSPKYFENIDNQLIHKFRLETEISNFGSKDIEMIRERNSVCISIKVEHNVGSPIYDVCGKDYWEKAIQYIVNKVDNPLFFICSDNVEYVKSHLIDISKYDTISQDKALPVHISLAIMGLCKHFIIGNTSFGWWAQHISDNRNKIVIAPKPWVKIDIPVDIYEPCMTLIDVSEYVESK